MTNIYTINGYKNRTAYLEHLGETFGIKNEIVIELASLLGAEEDFDGLINALEEQSWIEE